MVREDFFQKQRDFGSFVLENNKIRRSDLPSYILSLDWKRDVPKFPPPIRKVEEYVPPNLAPLDDRALP